MANKFPKKPSTTIERLKTIAACIGLIMFGVSVTAFIMSQMTPLRMDLDKSEKLCRELSKLKEEHLTKIKDLQLSNDSLVKENSKLEKEQSEKAKEFDAAKKQIEQLTHDNNKIQEKLNQKQSEVDRLTRTLNKSKKEPEKIIFKEKYPNPEFGEKIPNDKETAEHLNTWKRGNESQYDFDVWYIPINESKSFFSGEINITLFNIDKNGSVNAKVSSPGDQDMPINGFVGQSLIYKSKNDYNINIAKIYNNKNYSWVKFTIKKIPQGKGFAVAH